MKGELTESEIQTLVKLLIKEDEELLIEEQKVRAKRTQNSELRDKFKKQLGISDLPAPTVSKTIEPKLNNSQSLIMRAINQLGEPAFFDEVLNEAVKINPAKVAINLKPNISEVITMGLVFKFKHPDIRKAVLVKKEWIGADGVPLDKYSDKLEGYVRVEENKKGQGENPNP